MKTTKDLFLEQLDIAQYGHIVEKDDGKDHEYEMARRQLGTAATAIKRLMEKLGKGEGNLQAWVQSKLTKASDYIDSVADYMDAKDPVVKEAVELSNQVKEYIGEEDYRERTSNRNQQLRNIAYAILKRDPKSGVTTQNFPSVSPVFLETVHEILKKHGVHHGNHEEAINHSGVIEDIIDAHKKHRESREIEDNEEKKHIETIKSMKEEDIAVYEEETEVQYMVDKEGHKLDGEIIESYEVKSNGRVKVKTASGIGYIKEEDIALYEEEQGRPLDEFTHPETGKKVLGMHHGLTNDGSHKIKIISGDNPGERLTVSPKDLSKSSHSSLSQSINKITPPSTLPKLSIAGEILKTNPRN